MFDTSLLVDPAQVFTDLAAVIDALPARAVRGGTAVASDARIRSLLRLNSQLQARLLAEVAAFDDQGFASSLGARSTGSYLAAHAHLDAAAARRLVVAARTADRLPQLGSMLSAGDIGVDHVAAVGYATRRVPAQVLASEDHTFATLAASATPSDLRATGAMLTQLYDTDASSRDANHVRDSRYLTLSQTFDGAWHLQGLLTPEDGVALTLVLDSLSTKAGAEDERTPTQRRADALVEMAALTLRAGELPDTGGDQPRVTLLLQTKRNPFDHHDHNDDGSNYDNGGNYDDEGIGGDRDSSTRDDHPDDAASWLLPAGVTSGGGLSTDQHFAGVADGGGGGGGLSAEQHLAGKVPQQRRPARRHAVSVTAFNLADAQLLGAATMMTPETLQRICCDAQFNIATQDATGALLNLGRTTRDPTLQQRRAVKIRDKHCVFPGCDIPPQRCQVHHLHYWAHGGCTDLCNLALVCHFHHHLIHEDHWTLTVAPPTPEHPTGGWTARAPNGYQTWQYPEPVP